MGLLRLLTFPVSLPLAGGEWVLRTVLNEAERRYYDEAAIRAQMAQLEQAMLAGEIDDQTFDREEEALLERLLDARAYHERTAEDAEQADG